jgi:hypothetical protein
VGARGIDLAVERGADVDHIGHVHHPAPEVPAFEAAVRGEALGEVFGMMEVELTGPERLVGRGCHFHVILVVLAEHAVRIEAHQRVGTMSAHLANDAFAQRHLTHIAEHVGGVPELDDLGHPEDGGGATELGGVGSDGGLGCGPDGIPPVVGDAHHDHTPPCLGPGGHGAAEEQRHIVGVRHHQQYHPTVARRDVSCWHTTVLALLVCPHEGTVPIRVLFGQQS